METKYTAVSRRLSPHATLMTFHNGPANSEPQTSAPAFGLHDGLIFNTLVHKFTSYFPQAGAVVAHLHLQTIHNPVGGPARFQDCGTFLRRFEHSLGDNADLAIFRRVTAGV